jgi:hypothetical protein
MTRLLSSELLSELERDVQHALDTGDESALEVLGYGEISPVLALTAQGARFAAKRLPVFSSREAFERYRACFGDYLEALGGAGVQVVPTELQDVTRADGRIAAYCVQPALEPADIGPAVLAADDRERAQRMIADIIDAIARAVTPRLGLDAQLSNWVLLDGRLSYLDVTTPLLRDPEGRDRLDTELFLASLPWALRGAVRRFLLQGILDKYYQPRGVLLDFAANLLKEQLEPFVGTVIERSKTQLDAELSADEVRRYYADDARTWALLQRLRRWDRSWQRGVRRRPYPFLLPGEIER